jgi:hypothetical protein
MGDRLVRVQNANTAAPSGRRQLIGWCLNPEDLCVAKLCADREKDLNFVRALHNARLVDGTVIAERLLQVEGRHGRAAMAALNWLQSLPAPASDADSPRTSPRRWTVGVSDSLHPPDTDSLEFVAAQSFAR